MRKKKLTAEQVLYIREHYIAGDAEFGLKPLAEKFDVSRDLVKDVIHGEAYKEVGGPIHAPQVRLTAEIKAQIAACDDLKALALKLGLTEETLAKYLPKPKRAKVTEKMKAAILAEYVPYSKEYGREALAQKYGLSVAAVGQIVKDVPRSSAPQVPDYLKEAIIVAHDEEKLSIRALSERFSLSRPVIKSVLLEAGIEVRKKRVDEDTKQEVIEAYKAGQSLRDLEAIYGINRATISDWVRPFKREIPKKELTQELREQIYRYHSQGYGTTIISKTLGLPQSLVRRVIDGEI